MLKPAHPLQAFAYGDHVVRTFEIEGVIWFVLLDVARILGYDRAHNAARMLDDDEKGAHIVSTPSGAQEMLLVNESGVYHLTLLSRKPAAVPFRKWVTGEVLPALRKYGAYSVAGAVAELTPQGVYELVETNRALVAKFNQLTDQHAELAAVLKLHVKKPPRQRRRLIRELDEPVMKEMHAAGVPLLDIAVQRGCGHGTVHAIVNGTYQWSRWSLQEA